MQTALAGIERAVAVDSRTVRFDLRERKTEHARSSPARLPVFSRKWGDGKPFDQIVTEHPDHQRALRDRQGRHAAAHRVQAQSRLLGQRTSACDAATSTSTASSTACTRTRRSRARRSRPGEFDIMKEYGGALLGAPAPGREVARRTHRQDAVRDRGRPGPAVVPAQPAAADLPGHPRARGARLHLRLRDAEPLQAVQAREQRVQQLGVRCAGRAVARRIEVARAVSRRAAAACLRAGVRRAAHRRRPERAAPQPAEGARAVRAGRLEDRAPTASCATPRAKHSSSNTSTRARAAATPTGNATSTSSASRTRNATSISRCTGGASRPTTSTSSPSSRATSHCRARPASRRSTAASRRTSRATTISAASRARRSTV